MNITTYIKELQSLEEYSFSWDEIIQNCHAPISTLRKELSRLVDRKEIFNLRQGFYIIIPPRYQSFGKLPIQLYVDKLFLHLQKNYYVALYSAAATYGASHQRIQQDYILTVPPALRNIDKGAVKIRFFKVHNWPQKNVVNKKSDAGLYKVSSPALTAVDLVHYHSKIGGINRMLSNLDELIPEITLDDFNVLLEWYPYKSTLQRLGYLMDELVEDKTIPDIIFDHLSKEVIYPVLLTSGQAQKPGRTDNRWKIDVNIQLENDL